MPAKPVVSLAKLHFGEEPCISGKNGSGTVFFSGCSLSCVYCQNSEISRSGPNIGKAVSVQQLRDIYSRLKSQGAHNINLVTPTHFVREIAASLDVSPGIPVCYNTSGYEKAASLEMLRGKVQIFLTDYKYALPDVAEKYSSAADYPLVIEEALEKMYELSGDVSYDEDGMLLGGIIIRHLILPGNIENSIKVIEKVSGFSKEKKVIFSLMSQYVPHGNIESFPELTRTISKEEYEIVTECLFASPLEEGYVQDLDSATDELLPDFNLEGV